MCLDQASSDNARDVGLLAEGFAKKGWSIAENSSKIHIAPSIDGKRSYSTSSAHSLSTNEITCQLIININQ